jgi:hypothetical protein
MPHWQGRLFPEQQRTPSRRSSQNGTHSKTLDEIRSRNVEIRYAGLAVDTASQSSQGRSDQTEIGPPPRGLSHPQVSCARLIWPLFMGGHFFSPIRRASVN